MASIFSLMVSLESKFIQVFTSLFNNMKYKKYILLHLQITKANLGGSAKLLLQKPLY